MAFSFQHSDVHATGFDVTEVLADAEFAVVNADSKAAVGALRQAQRAGDAVFVGASAAPDAAAQLRRPIDPTRILKALAELVGARARPLAQAAQRAGNGHDDEPTTPSARRGAADAVDTAPGSLPVLDEAVTAASPAPVAAAPTPPSPAVSKAVLARDAAKAAVRGAVRRARISRSQPPRAPGPELSHDVLVLDADEASSASLAALLVRFGFGVQVVRSIEDAREAMLERFYIAYFLDIALDVGDSVGLLEAIHELPRPLGRTAPEVLMVVPQLQPSDRVRAALAGIGAPLLKPVTRGDLARALEGRGVTLPADARRS